LPTLICLKAGEWELASITASGSEGKALLEPCLLKLPQAAVPVCASAKISFAFPGVSATPSAKRRVDVICADYHLAPPQVTQRDEAVFQRAIIGLAFAARAAFIVPCLRIQTSSQVVSAGSNTPWIRCAPLFATATRFSSNKLAER
jgi:hypothetical protein